MKAGRKKEKLLLQSPSVQTQVQLSNTKESFSFSSFTKWTFVCFACACRELAIFHQITLKLGWSLRDRYLIINSLLTYIHTYVFCEPRQPTYLRFCSAHLIFLICSNPPNLISVQITLGTCTSAKHKLMRNNEFILFLQLILAKRDSSVSKSVCNTVNKSEQWI